MEHFAYTMRMVVAILAVAGLGYLVATGEFEPVLAPVFLLPFGIWFLWRLKL